MVKVTDLKISMHPKLVEKLDLMINRMEERGFDNFLIIDGKEGFGKSTFATQLCYYVKYNTKREFDHNNIYFRVEHLLEDMKKGRGKIFLLDEAELDLLSEQRGKMQRYFMQMLMAARKKNHFVIAIIPTIKKLKSFVVDRAIGLIRVYSPDNLHRGYYAYYREEAKNALYANWQRTRKMQYKKYYTFNGTFPNTNGKIIDEEEYDKKKDKAIESIGNENKEDTDFIKRANLVRYQIRRLWEDKKINMTAQDLVKYLKISSRTFCDWGNLPKTKKYLHEYMEIND